jgi:hypothetical protein
MLMKAPSTLDCDDVVKALVLLFDFQHFKEKDLSDHLRKGSMQVIVTTRSDGRVCVNLHHDVGGGPRHKVLERSKTLSALEKCLHVCQP